MLPRIAMPSARPSTRGGSVTADPTPASSSGTVLMVTLPPDARVTHMSAPSTATAAANTLERPPDDSTPTRATQTMAAVVVQPCSPPWTIEDTSALSPTSDSTAPTGSSGVSDSSRDSGANVQIATIVTATSGRFTRTAEPHQNVWSNAPDTI